METYPTEFDLRSFEFDPRMTMPYAVSAREAIEQAERTALVGHLVAAQAVEAEAVAVSERHAASDAVIGQLGKVGVGAEGVFIEIWSGLGARDNNVLPTPTPVAELPANLRKMGAWALAA